MGNLEQTLAVNPFGNEIEVDKMPEAVQDVKFEISEKVSSVFKEYKTFCSTHPNHGVDYPFNLYSKILSPLEIDLFLQLAIQDGPEFTLGYLISDLINYSYGEKNNNFKLTSIDCNLYGLLKDVRGKEKNPVIATVFGNVGDIFGYKSEHCAFDVKGNAGDHFGYNSEYCNYILGGNSKNTLGRGSKNCNYDLLKNVGHSCGSSSEKCTYNIAGNAGNGLGFISEKSTYNLTGDADEYLGYRSKWCTYNICGKIKAPIGKEIENSVFRIVNEENYDLLVQELPATNTVQLVDGAGGIIMETKK